MALTKAEKEKLEHLENELAGANKLIGEQIEQINDLESELQAAKDALQPVESIDTDLPTRKELRLAMMPLINLNHGHSEAQKVDRAITEILEAWS